MVRYLVIHDDLLCKDNFLPHPAGKRKGILQDNIVVTMGIRLEITEVVAGKINFQGRRMEDLPAAH